MRTIFEDTTLKAEMEESRNRGNERKSTLPLLWLVALLFLGGVWGVYRWADSHDAVAPPAPPVSLDDPKQRAEAFGKFNQSILNGNWVEAEAMLSTAAKQRLTEQQKSLPESLLGKFKDYKIVMGEMTQSIDTSVQGMVRLDCLYKFTDDPINYTKVEEKIIPLTLVIENGRLVIDNWEGVGSEERKEGSGSKPVVNK
ncbi:MAG TPA: hypothetical protein VKS99_11830 [Blastocatellia bacterium]|nr:hypothetical protein [Blastocatellia bacterium]